MTTELLKTQVNNKRHCHSFGYQGTVITVIEGIKKRKILQNNNNEIKYVYLIVIWFHSSYEWNYC